MSEINYERVLTHVSGCLYYYGAMSGRDLYERLQEFGELEMPYDRFSRLIRACGKDEDSEFPFIYRIKFSITWGWKIRRGLSPNTKAGRKYPFAR